jgi:DNA-binding NarL/FixJ family response regulator
VLNGIQAMASAGSLRIAGEPCAIPAENPFALQPGRYVCLTVKDQGPGIPAEVLPLTIPGGMGGKEAIARLRALDPAVVAIVSSGYSTDPVMAHHVEYGFRGVLVKPYLVEDLREVLTRLLDSRGREARG